MSVPRTRREVLAARRLQSNSPDIPLTGFAAVGLVTTLVTVLAVTVFAFLAAWLAGATPDPKATQAEIDANHLQAAAAALPFKVYALALAITALLAAVRRSTIFALITVALLLLPVVREFQRDGLESGLRVFPYVVLQIAGYLGAIPFWIAQRRQLRQTSNPISLFDPRAFAAPTTNAPSGR